MLLWLDLETTGLNPRYEHILELGLVLTDNDLDLIDEHTQVIRPHGWEAIRPGLDDFIVNMHTKNGLLDAVEEFGISTIDAEIAAVEWLRTRSADQLPTAGSTVSFDRGFLAEHMPNLNSAMHYRCVDVSTLKELARIWSPEAMIEPRGSNKAHRARADLDDSIAELHRYRQAMFR